MPEIKYCPCCGRHCSLLEPRCGRGREYLRTIEEGPDRAETEQPCPRRDDGFELDERLSASLRDLAHTMHMLHEGRGSQNRVLTLLLETGEVTQRELTQRMGVQPGSASEVIGKLESAGLIRRTPSSADLRTADICLTGAGRAQAERAAEQRKARRGEMFACLSEEEKLTLLALVEKLTGSWEACRRDCVPGEADGPRAPHGPHGHHGPHGQWGRKGHGRHGGH